MKTLSYCVLFLLLALNIMPSLAQAELSASHDFANGVQINFPDDWEILEADDGLHLQSNLTDMIFNFAPYTDEEAVEAELINIFETVRQDEDIEFEADDIFFGGLANFSNSASYFFQDNFEDNSLQRALFVIPSEETIIVKVSVQPLSSREIDELSLVLRILASLTYDANAETSNNLQSSENTSEYRWPSGVIITYPTNYELSEDGDTIHLLSADTDIAISLFPRRDERESNRPNTIRQSFSSLTDAAFDEENFFFVDLTNDSKALAYLHAETHLLIALQPADIVTALALVSSRTEDSLDLGTIEAVYEILGTMRISNE